MTPNSPEPSLFVMSCAIISAVSFVGTFVHLLFPTLFPVVGRKVIEVSRLMWSSLKKNLNKLVTWIQKLIRAKPEMPLDLERSLIKNHPSPIPSAPLDSDQEEEDEELQQFASEFAN
ncbi:unnamed protein product [Caenorhabditis brenneri]